MRLNMSGIDLTAINQKGEIVIPDEILNQLNVSKGSKFVITTDGNKIFLKPVQKSKKELFDDLIKRSRATAKEEGIKNTDLPDIIKQVRNESGDRY